MNPAQQVSPGLRRISIGLLLLCLAACLPASAQLLPSDPDPLARIREAAKSNVQACSATGETLCEQVAPKILGNAQGDSLKRFYEITKLSCRKVVALQVRGQLAVAADNGGVKRMHE